MNQNSSWREGGKGGKGDSHAYGEPKTRNVKMQVGSPGVPRRSRSTTRACLEELSRILHAIASTGAAYGHSLWEMIKSIDIKSRLYSYAESVLYYINIVAAKVPSLNEVRAIWFSSPPLMNAHVLRYFISILPHSISWRVSWH